MSKKKYRSITVTIWQDKKFRALSSEAQLVWFHLYTNRFTTGIGLYSMSMEGLAADMRWDVKRYRKALQEPIDMGMARVDEDYQLVYFPQYFIHNMPDGPKQLQGVMKSWDYIEDCDLKWLCFKNMREIFKEKESLLKVLDNVCSNPPDIENSEQRTVNREQRDNSSSVDIIVSPVDNGDKSNNFDGGAITKTAEDMYRFFKKGETVDYALESVEVIVRKLAEKHPVKKIRGLFAWAIKNDPWDTMITSHGAFLVKFDAIDADYQEKLAEAKE